MEVGVGVLERVLPVLHRHHDAYVVGRARAAHVGPDDRREVAAGAGQQRGREGLGHRERPHGVGVARFSKATVSTFSWVPDATRWAATMAVDPPTEPAVWTRIIGFPTAPRAGAR